MPLLTIPRRPIQKIFSRFQFTANPYFLLNRQLSYNSTLIIRMMAPPNCFVSRQKYHHLNKFDIYVYMKYIHIYCIYNIDLVIFIPLFSRGKRLNNRTKREIVQPFKSENRGINDLYHEAMQYHIQSRSLIIVRLSESNKTTVKI